MSHPVRSRVVRKEQLLWGRVAPSWGFVISVGEGKNKRRSPEESGAV